MAKKSSVRQSRRTARNTRSGIRENAANEKQKEVAAKARLPHQGNADAIIQRSGPADPLRIDKFYSLIPKKIARNKILTCDFMNNQNLKNAFFNDLLDIAIYEVTNYKTSINSQARRENTIRSLMNCKNVTDKNINNELLILLCDIFNRNVELLYHEKHFGIKNSVGLLYGDSPININTVLKGAKKEGGDDAVKLIYLVYYGLVTFSLMNSFVMMIPGYIKEMLIEPSAEEYGYESSGLYAPFVKFSEAEIDQDMIENINMYNSALEICQTFESDLHRNLKDYSFYKSKKKFEACKKMYILELQKIINITEANRFRELLIDMIALFDVGDWRNYVEEVDEDDHFVGISDIYRFVWEDYSGINELYAQWNNFNYEANGKTQGFKNLSIYFPSYSGIKSNQGDYKFVSAFHKIIDTLIEIQSNGDPKK